MFGGKTGVCREDGLLDLAWFNNLDLIWEVELRYIPICVLVLSWSWLGQMGLDHLDLFADGIRLRTIMPLCNEDATATRWGCRALSRPDSVLHLEWASQLLFFWAEVSLYCPCCRFGC